VKEIAASLDPPDAAGASDPANHGIIAVNASEPGSYPCSIFLYPFRSAVPDFRIYEIEAAVTAGKIQTSFTFRAPARQTIVQVR